MSNDIHNLWLASVCRVCGCKIKNDKKYCSKFAVSYANELELLFAIKILEDTTLVHPTKLCKKCYLKCYHQSKKIVPEKKKIFKPHFFEFKIHIDESCICTSSISQCKHSEMKLFVHHSLFLQVNFHIAHHCVYR